jgi:hypothetical protein
MVRVASLTGGALEVAGGAPVVVPEPSGAAVAEPDGEPLAVADPAPDDPGDDEDTAGWEAWVVGWVLDPAEHADAIASAIAVPATRMIRALYHLMAESFPASVRDRLRHHRRDVGLSSPRG